MPKPTTKTKIPPPPPRVFAFTPSQGHPDQLRPVPFSVAAQGGARGLVCLIRGRPFVDLGLCSGAFSGSAEFAPEDARQLAAQLLAAAEQIEAGGAA